jgi:Protein of unknown function (DUF3592)
MTISLKYGKSGPVTFPFQLRVLGFLLGLCAIVAVVKTASDTYQESKNAKWPSVIATITQQSIQQSFEGRYNTISVWHIESNLRYRIDGQEVTSSIRSRTGSSEQRSLMRGWASQHPPGTPLPVRYDPQHPKTVVPDGGDMPQSGPQALDDLKLSLLFLLVSIALVTAGRMLQPQAEFMSDEKAN